MYKEFKSISTTIFKVYWTLIKVMVPALIIVKLLEELGAADWLAHGLSPLMQWVGLPAEMGIVWAVTMLVNIYTGMAVFFSLALTEPLTVAQITVLTTMMLLAHGLIVEGAIAKAAGLAWSYTIALRVGGGLILGFILHHFYSHFGMLQEASEVIWRPDSLDNSLLGWITLQLETLVFAFVIIAALVIIMRLLEVLGVEAWIHYLLTPFLKVVGIGKEAANITVIGFTLGLSFGGGLLIEQAKSGKVSKRNIFLSMSFLCLAHSLIEDTLLMVLLGAHLSGILWARLLFCFLMIATIAFVTREKPTETQA